MLTQIIKKIVGKIWLLWGAIIFLLSWLWAWPAYLLIRLFYRGEKRYKAAFAFSKFWGICILSLLGIRIKTYGKENRQENNQVIYVSNHRSQIDIPVNFITNPRFVILSKAQVAKIPVVRSNLHIGHVLVDRSDKESRIASVEALCQHINEGRSILLYPEGRRVREDVKLGKFHNGAFRLAIKYSLPVVPITIVGSDQINNPKNPLALYPGKVAVYFDESIETKQLTMDDIDTLKQRVKEQMLQHL